MADSHEQLSKLSPQQRALLLSRLKKRKQQAAKEEKKVIIRQSRDSSEFPLSFAQQRVWFLEQLEKDSVAYNFAMAFSLVGRLHVSAFEKSINDIVKRHEMLRTTFKMINGQPVQVISPAQTIPLNKNDLTHLPKNQQTEKVKNLAREEATSPFDLIDGPLLRVSLLKLDDEDHVLFLTTHHIAFDGWSKANFNSELSTLYQANVNGTTADLPDLAIQYADFSFWQNQLLNKDRLTGQLDYWKRRLAGAPPVVSFPTDKARARSLKTAVSAETFSIDPELTDKLKQLCRQSSTTLFTAVFAVFSLLLSRYSESQDVVVGLPVADRSHSETENLIGLFLNTIALRIDLTAQLSFHQLLDQVKQVFQEALDNQDVPFQKLVEELHPERNLQHTPVFQVMFILQSAPKEGIDLTGLEVTPLKLQKTLPGTNYDITFSVEEKPNEIAGIVEYNSDLYTPDLIYRIAENFQTLMESVINSPEKPVSTLPFLAASEKERLLFEWNQTSADYPRSQTIHGLFEQQVSKSPDAIALEFEGQTLSYSQLNSQANQLAHYLQKKGVGADVIVAICVQRSLEMVIGLLAILKAGGAYLPLDRSNPAERLNYLLEDSGAKLLLSNANLPAGLITPDTRIICLERESGIIAEQDDKNLAPSSTADNLAFVMYTSGSTGKPKGVMGLHHSIVNRLFWGWSAYPYAAGDRCCQKTTLNFVDSIPEIFSPLLSGLSLVVADEETSRDGRALAKLLARERVTHLVLVPSLLQVLLKLDEEALNGLDCVRCWLAGGERLEPELEFAFHARFPDAVLLNMYGASEVSGDAMCYDAADRDGRGGSLIGRPIANTRAYVLDGSMNLLPMGVPGELYIGGDGLTRGYLNQPGLTDERFVPDPFSDEPGARLYRMGDRVRYLADGSLEYLGRLDHQIKLRGIRIELGEIETTLLQLTAVSDAVVVVREDDSGDKRLDAYVVPTAKWIEQSSATKDGDVDGVEAEDPLHHELIAELRQQLRQKLPAYMLPSLFVVLEALPLNPNGKVDRNALPVPGDVRASLGVEYTAPRSDLERKLVQVWAEVLKLEQVGVHDNFFDLGGHSLMATQVVSRIRGQLNLELPLSEMFAYPTVAELAPVVKSLLDEGGEEEVEVIPVVDRAGNLPLSFAQERLWFLDQLEPGNAFYNIPLVIRLQGELSVASLTKSLDLIVQRHETLRTRFSSRDGSPLQVIDEDSVFALLQEDLGTLPDEARDKELEHRIRREAMQPFDLAHDFPVRARLLRLSERNHVLLFTMHHIISDGWSLGVLFRELGASYAEFSSGRPAELPDLPVQYADFASWQREWLSGEVLALQLDYWKHQLDGLTTLDLPTDRPRPPLRTYNGAVCRNRLPKKFEAELERFSQQHGVSLFMTLLAAFAGLLHRYSGQEDIVVGSPIANRNRSELEGLIGFFVNSLVMRTDVSGNPSFTELVGRVKRTVLGASDHQDLPFEKLVEVLQPTRDRSRNPLFQVMFALQNASTEKLDLQGLALEVGGNAIQVTRFDLEVHIWQRVDTFDINIIYNTDLFDADSIRRMLEHYRNLLQAVVVEPDLLIAELSILSAEEQRQFVDWNRTATDYPRDKTVHELFEHQAAASPDAVAVEYGSKTLGYRQLNERANRLAHYLQARGVGPEVLVGVYMERSPEMVVGLLGILKAGGAYVPLDLEYPQSRITFMLEDAGVPVLLSLSSLSEQLPDFAGELVCLDSDWTIIANESANNPASAATADNLAYVIYTSGSTGTPKGVEIPHRAINRLVRNTDYYQVDATDRIAQVSNVSFDAATFEIWGALLNGAQLIGIDKEVLLNSKSLAVFLQEQGITTMFLTTALFNQIARETPGAFKGLRGLMFGGEAVDPGAVRQVLASNPPERLLHVYGPTESTTFASWYQVEAVTDDASLVPIGRPLANTRLYILDQNMNPVPVGVPGELYIGGDGLARGYLNQPELTEEKFVANPFSDDSSARLYRTGDNVRYRSDGAIEFLGRFDHQVKLRGFRVELGEIESVLLRQQVVSDAVVIVHEDEPGDKRLVAYVVVDSSDAPSGADLRDFVAKSLPNYMVPSAFIVLDKFPLTANGKVDREALPVPGNNRASLGAEYTAPRTEQEQLLAEIWSEVLKLERVGVHDNFFDLGGHSLMATQVVSRIRSQLNIEFPLSEMFGYSTVAELAPVVESLLAEGGEEEVDVIPVVDREGNLPLSFAQERLWFLDQLKPGSSAYNIPLALRLKGELSVAALENSLNAIVSRQEALRTRFASHQGNPIQVIEDVRIELPQEDLSALPSKMLEDEVKVRVDEEALLPFELSTGPLLRCRLLRLSEREYVLLLTMHHIISDGWSLGILFRELGDCYKAFSGGKQPELAELPIQYADFAVWQRQWLTGKQLDRQLDYWSKQLADLPIIDLPTDRARPAMQTYDGAIETLFVDKRISEQLEQLSRDSGVTLFMTLLAAYVLMLHRYSGQDDIVIGSPIANRNRSELEELIAFFVNMLVIRVDCSGNPDFNTLIKRVNDVALSAYEHQDIPFERLVDVLQVERDPSRNPLFQVQFALQNAPLQSLELSGLTLKPVSAEIRFSHFDLECHVWNKAQGLQLVFVYNTNLFDATTIQRMQKHFANLLEAFVVAPDMHIDDAPMLDEREREQLLIDWNQTATDYPRDKTVHELFEQQVLKTPEKIAIEYENEKLSYARLNQRANQLAHHLQARGVGPEVMVGICVERSLEMVVGLLGVLKSGGAYLPLDPDYPLSRLGFMLEDAEVKTILTTSSQRACLPSFSGDTICLDVDWDRIELESTDNPVSGATANNLIYVIYTSGSTGRPKGTLIEHRSAVRLVKETNFVELGEDEVFLQFAPIAFDASTFELWGSLLNGARLAIFPAGRASLEEVGQVIQRQDVTTLWLTSALFSQMADNHLASLSGVKQLLAGGEALSLPHVKKMLAQLGDRRLINGYGPTENTTFTCCHVMTSNSELEQSVPIGRPISNTTVYVLDGRMQPVPIGVPGQLYIGGDGLARGYLNQPEMTADKFVANPFSDDPGARLYATGDQVRYRPDGAIEFIGRIDHQVKIRGYRIELGEIETALVEHAAVDEAVTIVREDEPGEKRIAAYVVPSPTWVDQFSSSQSGEHVDQPRAPCTETHGKKPSKGSPVNELIPLLRRDLKQQLPEYMLPSVYVVLDALPLNPNGKVERKALPVPGDVRAGLGAEYTAPRTEQEQQLAEIWSEVLKIERVGVHDNFFDLGGHSLMATQVVSRIRGQLNIELPLSDMFGCPTVAELASALESLLHESGGGETNVIPIADREGDLPLSFAQERLWFLDQLEPGGTAYNMALALRLMGELSVAALEDSLNAIVARQEGLRTHFTLYQGKPFQVIEDSTIELLQDDLSALKSEMLENEVKARIDAEALQPFDLNAGPLLRCRLLRLSDHEHVLLLTMHHVISDGWSLGVLFRELGACYEAFSRGETPALARLPIQYADFAVWQREWLSGEVLASQMAYWRENLQGLSTLNLPTDRPRPAVQTYIGSSERMALDAGLSKQLTSLSRQVGVTLFMTMLSGFAVLMHRYSGQEDIVVGTPIANRNRSELEDLVGFFVNSLVMRTDVSGNPGFRELVQRVNRTALDAYEHQDLPFEKLVDEIQPDRDLSHNPLFQVMFALQNAPIGSLELKGLTLESISREIKVSGFDLECHVWERGDRLEVIFMYNTDLFDASTIRRMMTHYRRLLEASTDSPETPVSQLEILDDEEKQLILHQWNQTRADFVNNETLHSLFDQQMQRTPQAMAVRFEQHSLDYSELGQKANDIAALLLAKNVAPGQLVGVYLERSIDLVVAVLGILKAGAAYVPLDPDYPEERTKYVVADSNVRVLLSQKKFEDQLPSAVTDVIYLDSGELYENVNPQTLPVVTDDMLAYVIYTSGSTGKPKGVMVSHAAVVNHAFWMQDLFKLDQTDSILQKSPISFDASVCEIFVPLLKGACVVLAVPGGDKDINYLVREIQKNKVTTLILVPSALRILLQSLTDTAALSTLKRMGVGGEALTPELQQAYYEKCSAPLYNLYGPTESTIDATSFLCEANFDRDNIPIGYPVSNKRAYILDHRMQPVPIGVHGELHIGGAGLAQGYLNQPELTAEKFIVDPFSDDPEARLYKTGDMARYRVDGSIEFFGRIDHQVKVRGFRIELGEIETVLAQHEHIKDCAALIYEDLQGNKNIAAYFVSDSSFSTLSLRNFLRKKLPHYMIPTLLTKLDEIPVTPNGKTDYKTLASYTKGKAKSDSIYAPPETTAEKKIASIWETLLNVDRIGVGDNFFDIGGHSLLLIQAKFVIESEVGVSVPVVDFFHQTLGQIATYCEKNKPREMSREEV